MAINRRKFVHLGAMGAAGIVSASCKWPWPRSPVPPPTLKVHIKGLVLLQQQGKSVTVHLVDHTKVGLMTHEPFLEVRGGLIDAGTTTAPSIPNPKNPAMRLFNLNGTVTLDTGTSASPDLEMNDDPIDENVPVDDAHWRSVKYAARLATICGATKVTDTTKFLGSLTLDHGHLHSIPPDTSLGRLTVWTFTRELADGTDQKVVKQAMTNALVCDVAVTRSVATFTIGGQKLVLNVGSIAEATVRHLPPAGMSGVCKASLPCVDHMETFYDLVDAAFKPKAIGLPPLPSLPSAEPDYCPPAMI